MINYMEICVMKPMNLRSTPLGWQPLKKWVPMYLHMSGATLCYFGWLVTITKNIQDNFLHSINIWSFNPFCNIYRLQYGLKCPFSNNFVNRVLYPYFIMHSKSISVILMLVKVSKRGLTVDSF